MAKNQTSKKILNVTLEIIYLLTGEDYIVVNKASGEHVTPSSSHSQVSGGWSRTESPIMKPPPHSPMHDNINEQKILELTNKIIYLLTGEVCNYIDDDLYEDLIIENHQPHTPLDQPNARDTRGRLPSPSRIKDGLTAEQGVNGTSQEAKYSPMFKEETITYIRNLTEEYNGKRDLPDSDPETSIEQNKYRSDSSTEDSCEEETSMEPGASTQTETSSMECKKESQEGSLGGTDPDRTKIKRKTDGWPGVTARGAEASNKCLSVNSAKGAQNQHLMFALSHQIAPGIKTYKCSKCEESFTCTSDLLKHQTHHRGSRLFMCSECGKNFTSKSNLAKHHKIHTGEKPYSCSECGKRFREKHYLISHQAVHLGPQLIACPQCGKGYTSKSNLTKHQRIHTGQKPFACAECGKSFNQRSVLMTHRRTHTGEKPFCCHVCGKSFADNLQLVRHSATHTGEKPFICSECGKCFSQRNILLKHLNIHK